MEAIEALRKRCLIKDVTAGIGQPSTIKDGGATKTAYIGFDATAPSLHIGSLVPLMLAKNLMKHGYKIIVVLGGGTTKIGDPTGKRKEREMLSEETIQDNIYTLRPTFYKILGDDVIILDNDKWLSKLNYMDFLGDIGSCVPAGSLLNLESIKSRMDKSAPLSYLEMSYPLLQAYDFCHLNKQHQCTIQIGGSDQWGNITFGIDLVRRLGGDTVHGMTCPLLTNSQGNKMGKTEEGTIWLDALLTTPSDFYKYWLNVKDEDVIRFLKMLTLMPMEEIEKHEGKTGAKLNPLKILLADKVTAMVHSGVEGEQKTVHSYSKEEKADIINLIQSVETQFAEAKEQFADELMEEEEIRGINYSKKETDSRIKASLEVHKAICEDREELRNQGAVVVRIEGRFCYKVLTYLKWCESGIQAQKIIKKDGCLINGELVKDPWHTMGYISNYLYIELGKKGTLVELRLQ